MVDTYNNKEGNHFDTYIFQPNAPSSTRLEILRSSIIPLKLLFKVTDGSSRTRPIQKMYMYQTDII